ncbi:hypothetical protein DCG74_13860 [Bradyrhizobium sp. WBAH42]|nr:hypothetical protein DCG74_13860 [Bradyrhizobium sp. WBAH42]
MAVPSGALVALMRHLPPDAEVAIAGDDGAAVIAVGSAKFRLPAVPMPDLREPAILGAETGRVELDAKIARDLFARPAFAAAGDVSRAYLSGILLHSAGLSLSAVAADGVRICRVTAPAAGTLSTDRSLIIPNAMAKVIACLLGAVSGKVTLRRSERLLAIEGAGFIVVSRRIDATYPAYEKSIPSAGTNVVTTSRAEMRDALARFAAVADPQDRPHILSLRWDGPGLYLLSEGSEDRLSADSEGQAETAVQIQLLAETVNALRGDRIRIHASEPGRMVLITDPEDESFLAGLMPIRPRSP